MGKRKERPPLVSLGRDGQEEEGEVPCGKKKT